MGKFDQKLYAEKFKKAYNWVRNLNWNNPRVILCAVAILVLPFIAKYYVLMGILLGITMAISVLWLLEKSPGYIKDMVVMYPFASDIILTSLAVVLTGSYFGSGLTLGMGAVFCGVILSWALSHVEGMKKHETVQAV